ncbi:hypothetical protein PG999_011342 [Apiospora kogelbergensis]|uniref:UBA domain-containing protein n=1 Tax=Apiospora kogelbergensis TaxID=1337665 RepID=A0AAW0QCV9_9PEZI
MSTADTNVDTLCAITNVSRQVAVRMLQANGNNIDRAVNEFYDNLGNVDKYENAWDDKAFSAGRDGDDTQITGTVPAFNIQGPDETSNYQNSTGPTRPPSRAANRSPLGRLVDLTASETAGIADSANVPGAPTNAADEDSDLRRALAESAAQSGVPPQEVGVLDNDTNVKHFGPANRSDYQQDQWAMVPTKADGNTATADPPPSARKRMPGAPAFLRSVNDHRLGALVSIYHSIPLVRNILLSYGSGSAVKDYGSHMDWWKGHAIKGPAQEAGEAGASSDGAFPSFVDELQRLVAFLDSTDRCYGSADVLAQTEETNENLGKESDDHEDTAHFILLDVGSNDLNFQWGEVDCLYDALDRLFWNHALGPDPWDLQESKTATVEPSDVLTIRFNGEGLQRTCDIPAVLYVDRYVEERKNMAVELQIHINQLRQTGLKGIEAWRKSILECHHGADDQETGNWLDKPHGSRECWQKVIKTCEDLIQRLQQDAQWRQVHECVGEGNAPTMKDLFALQNTSGYTFTAEENAKHAALQEKIRLASEQLQHIELQMSEMERRHGQCKEALNNASKILTCREEEADSEFESKYIHKSDPQRYQPRFWDPIYRYHLRGVATAPGIAYLFAKEDGDLMQFEDQADTELLGQWWKVGYAARESQPITVEKTTLNDVLVAAGSESKHPILVYATEAAYKEDPLPVSQALRMFVQVDNRSFQQELSEEQQNHESAPAPNVPTLNANTWEGIDFASSAKRKHSRSSSLATLGSTGHCSDREMQMYNEDTFDDSKGPTTSHQEFASPSPQSNKLGGLVASLASLSSTSGAVPHGKQETEDREGRPISFLAHPPNGEARGRSEMNLMNMEMEVDEEQARHLGFEEFFTCGWRSFPLFQKAAYA